MPFSWTNEKAIPIDLKEGIASFIGHLVTNEAAFDKEHLADEVAAAERIENLMRCYEVEVRRETAHIWKLCGQKSSVAWIVLGDGLIVKSPKPDPLQRPAAHNMPHFMRGDILKSATWKAPAKNFARGNVLNDKQFPRWHWNGWI